MKIRTGFVSNSSSSSFVLTTTKENWENVKKELEPFQIAVAEFIMKHDTFAGIDVVTFSTWRNHSTDWAKCAVEYNGFDYEGAPSERFGTDIDGAWRSTKQRLLKDKELITARGEDW